MLKHKIKTMPLADLTPADFNPRKISKEALEGLGHSIKRFGLVQPIIFNKRSGNVVGGHQRLKVLQAAGEIETTVIEVDLAPMEEKALNVSLNNPAISGEFTDDLQSILDEIKLEMPAVYADLKLDELSSLALEDGSVVEDEVPPIPKKAITKKGQMILMGDHRLLCGDSTNSADVAKLMEDPADMIFTDPPWNVAIGKDSNPKHRQRPGLINDDLGKDFSKFLNGWTAVCLPYLRGDLYCVMGCGEWPAIDASLRASGMHWSASIVWVKDVFVLGRANYHRSFEPIWYGWPKQLKSSFTGQRDVDDVWEIQRPKVSKDHPTMKPVELVARAVNNSSKADHIVFDPFSGAGSTLMACQQLGRRFVGIEIDPLFCDVIIKRWENLMNKKAKRV